MKACQDLLNQDGHIRNIIQAQSSIEIMKNRLHLKTSIDTVRWLTFQACAFRGYDESTKSLNQDNFLELIKLLACYNDEVVLENAPSNSKYTSHLIQKEILHILSSRVKKYIREEIGDSKFCIIVDLLTLSCALAPKDNYKAFNLDIICIIVENYHPMDFNEQEKINLKFQLWHFIIDARQASSLNNLSTIQELCSSLVATQKKDIYYLINRLFRLIMTLPVSTTTTERSFSAMKIIKTRLRNKMEADFLGDNMTVNIEREIAASIDYETIIDDFKLLKNHRAPF